MKPICSITCKPWIKFVPKSCCFAKMKLTFQVQVLLVFRDTIHSAELPSLTTKVATTLNKSLTGQLMCIIIFDSMPKRLIQKVMSDKAVLVDHVIRINLEIQNRKKFILWSHFYRTLSLLVNELPLFQN